MSELPPDTKTIETPTVTAEIPTVPMQEVNAGPTEAYILTDEPGVAWLGMKRWVTAFRAGMAEHVINQSDISHRVSSHSAEYALQEDPVHTAALSTLKKPGSVRVIKGGFNLESGDSKIKFEPGIVPKYHSETGEFTGIDFDFGLNINDRNKKIKDGIDAEARGESQKRDVDKEEVYILSEPVERRRAERPVTWPERRASLFRARQVRKMNNLRISSGRLKKDYSTKAQELGSIAPRDLFSAERGMHGRNVRTFGERRDYAKAYRQQRKNTEGGIIKRALGLPVGYDRIRETTEQAIRGESPMQKLNIRRQESAKDKAKGLREDVEVLRAQHQHAKGRQQKRNNYMDEIKRRNTYFASQPANIDKTEAEFVAASPLVTKLKKLSARATKSRAAKSTVDIARLNHQIRSQTDSDNKQVLAEKLTRTRQKKAGLASKAYNRYKDINRRRTETGKVDVTGWM
ncbi:MAG TPA: hypothetical protein VLF39_04270 [Candidatus Saccharimonadales bacterium]|nr:hypothetical protein [Candidatus Saccharimonadales bacterium]